jgi:hypothetical protein
VVEPHPLPPSLMAFQLPMPQQLQKITRIPLLKWQKITRNVKNKNQVRWLFSVTFATNDLTSSAWHILSCLERTLCFLCCEEKGLSLWVLIVAEACVSLSCLWLNIDFKCFKEKNQLQSLLFCCVHCIGPAAPWSLDSLFLFILVWANYN